MLELYRIGTCRFCKSVANARFSPLSSLAYYKVTHDMQEANVYFTATLSSDFHSPLGLVIAITQLKLFI